MFEYFDQKEKEMLVDKGMKFFAAKSQMLRF